VFVYRFSRDAGRYAFSVRRGMTKRNLGRALKKNPAKKTFPDL
jgi:hypothetical protein